MSVIIRELPKTTMQCYLTGMTALNIPSPDGTGDWHFHDAFFGRPDRPPHYTVNGKELADTGSAFGNGGIYDCKPVLRRYGVFSPDKPIRVAEPNGPVYAANHYRASADLLVHYLLPVDFHGHAASTLSLYSIDDWLSTKEEKNSFWDFIQPLKRIFGEGETWRTITEWFNREMTLA